MGLTKAITLLKPKLFKINRFLITLEKAGLGIIFGFLLTGSILQIVMRTCFDSGFTWMDPLLRASLLFITMIGSCIAVYERKHIQIDFIKYVAPPRISNLSHKIISILGALLCMFSSILAWIFFRTEYTFKDPFVLNLKMYHIQIIFPVCFFLMSFHFLCESLSGECTES